MSFDAIGIVSQDIATSVRFYALLGIELIETGGPDHYEGATPSGIRFMLDARTLTKQINPDWKEPSGSSRMSLAFKFDTPEEVNEAYTSILDAGFVGTKEPWDAFWGQRYAYVHDPDGNEVALFAELSS